MAGEDPFIFAIALETLAVKAFGDMGQMARLRLIRDHFIAGYSSFELRMYLDSVPPETPIRDVVDRCRVWESHADPEIRRVSSPPGSVVRFDPRTPGRCSTDSRSREEVDMRSSSVSSVVEPKSVPSRISVVLVEVAEVHGAECLASVPVDKALRLLVGAACLASVTVCEDCIMMPGVVGMLSRSISDSVGPVGPGGTLSSSDLAAILFPAVPAVIPFPVGPVDPFATLSPSDSDSVGPVGPFGTLSPSESDGPVGPGGTLSSSDLAGILFPAIPAEIPFPVGPVGPFGTLSPSDSDSVGPDGTLSSSDLARILFPAIPAGIPFPVGPVGPFGTLSPSDSGGPDGTLSSSNLAEILFPAVPAGIPFPVGPDGPVGTLSPSDSDGPVGPGGMLSLTLNLPTLWALLGRCPSVIM